MSKIGLKAFMNFATMIYLPLFWDYHVNIDVNFMRWIAGRGLDYEQLDHANV